MVSGFAGCECEHCVTCRGVTIDGNAAEGRQIGVAQHLLQESRLHCCIGENITQHGCHVGRDHAAPFDHTDDFDAPIADYCAGFGAFCKCVGGADRVGDILPTAGWRFKSSAQTSLGFVFGEGHPDNASRRNENLALIAAEMLGDLFGDGLNGLATAIAGKGIAVSRVDDQCARLATFEIVAAKLDFG